MKAASKIPLTPYDIIAEMLRDAATSWSVGTFGALAEFSYNTTDPPVISATKTALSAITARGAIHIQNHPIIRLFPYEGLSSLENAWTQGVLVCLPNDQATLHNRTGLFEIGQDTNALSSNGLNDMLFDLGLGVAHLDACIRTNNLQLIRHLQSHSGASLFNPAFDLVGLIAKANPTRVFQSKIARIEVYQEIPDDQGGTPAGPHTHLSEKLLSHRQTQAATIPLPDGWVPVLAFYPANPGRDAQGSLRPFDGAAHQRFQTLFIAFGASGLVQIKQDFLSAMTNHVGPENFRQPTSKAERTSLRIAIRQYALQFEASALLSEWQRFYEPTGRQ